jgi:hypothetical protein
MVTVRPTLAYASGIASSPIATRDAGGPRKIPEWGAKKKIKKKMGDDKQVLVRVPAVLPGTDGPYLPVIYPAGAPIIKKKTSGMVQVPLPVPVL